MIKDIYICHFLFSTNSNAYHPKILNVDINGFKTNTKQISAYPYNTLELVAFFVYGDDFLRYKYHIFNESEAKIVGAVFVFFLLVAIVLCYVRKSRKLRRDSYISSLIDVCITFFGGGNLQMNDKLERWIFGIMLFGCFFITSFWFEYVLFPSFLLREHKIKKFSELSKINPPIYMANYLKPKKDIVQEMLRFNYYIKY